MAPVLLRSLAVVVVGRALEPVSGGGFAHLAPQQGWNVGGQLPRRHTYALQHDRPSHLHMRVIVGAVPRGPRRICAYSASMNSYLSLTDAPSQSYGSCSS